MEVTRFGSVVFNPRWFRSTALPMLPEYVNKDQPCHCVKCINGVKQENGRSSGSLEFEILWAS